VPEITGDDGGCSFDWSLAAAMEEMRMMTPNRVIRGIQRLLLGIINDCA